jgi:WD40 repeat protein
VAWAHPKYGNILASSSYDGKVIIWREQSSTWQKIYEVALHTASVNLVAWAPHEAGCLLACASSDGNVSVLEFKDNAWTHQIFQACGSGVNSVSWAPAVAPGQVISASGNQAGAARRFVTGGSDCQVKLWDFSAETGSWQSTQILTGHTDWVRDVAWSPTVLSKSYIASASQDKTVRIWTSSDLRTCEQGWKWKNWLTMYRRLEVHHPQRRGGRVARELESERKRTGGQHWRQQGQLVEGEAKRRLGVRQDIGGVGGCGRKDDITVSTSMHEKLERRRRGVDWGYHLEAEFLTAQAL